MSLSKLPYRGTRDFFPAAKREQDYMFSTMRHVASIFGHEPYDGPLLEEVDLYRAKSGDELINEQIYSFIDRGEREVAIRPEMTPTLARMVSQVHREIPRPIRWYSIPNLMRYEKPQRGRLREHWQFNCDIFGAPEGQGEIEILQLAISLLENFGAKQGDFEILLNDRQLINCIFNDLLELDESNARKFYKILDRAKKVPAAALEAMIDETGIGSKKSIFEEYRHLASFEALKAFIHKHNLEDKNKHFLDFIKMLDSLSLMNYVKFDPSIVRGLDYYTGVVFEIYDRHPDNNRAIAGGGAYGNLLQIFDEPALGGVGLGLGDVTLGDFLRTHKLMPDFSKPTTDLFLTFQDESARIPALNLASTLRHSGVKVTTHLDPIKFSKAFPLAEKRGAHFVSFMGERELANSTVQIKNLTTKEQADISSKDFQAIAKHILTKT